MTSADQIRADAARLSLKVEALDWLDKNSPVDRHVESCCSLDDTGYPAPCTCGLNERVRISRFIRDAIVKA